jgi:hypothetical protein
MSISKSSVAVACFLPGGAKDLSSPSRTIHFQDTNATPMYRSAGKSLARPTSRCILFDGENILFDASLVIYINNINIPPIMILNRISGVLIGP